MFFPERSVVETIEFWNDYSRPKQIFWENGMYNLSNSLDFITNNLVGSRIVDGIVEYNGSKFEIIKTFGEFNSFSVKKI